MAGDLYALTAHHHSQRRNIPNRFRLAKGEARRRLAQLYLLTVSGGPRRETICIPKAKHKGHTPL
jgi:hypothetical protein